MMRFAILETSTVGPDTVRMVVDAPRVAAHAQPGQFVIVRATPNGERIPLTISSWDRTEGSIALVIQGIGRSTKELIDLEAGAQLADVLGPLGQATEVDKYGTCAVVAGGVGAAIGLPVAAALVEAGNRVVAVLGGRTADHIILTDEFRSAGCELSTITDDGSSGRQGLVTDALSELLDNDQVDRVFTIGPIVMMRAVADLTNQYGVDTIASLNPIMIDGTGMCGGCRVQVGGKTLFACVDGPEFDAHEVDFESLATRNLAYRAFEECEMAIAGSSDG